MAGPHAHDDNGQHDVTPTDAPTAGIGLYFGTQTGKTEHSLRDTLKQNSAMQ